MEDLLAWDARCPSVPRRLPLGTEQVNSPLSWQEWDRCLASHPDRRFRRYIVDGIRRGFRIGFDYSHADYTRSSPNNMISAGDHPEVVGEYLAAECGAGRVLGPFDPARFPLVHTSRFGLIPKGSSGKWRLIVDMSSRGGKHKRWDYRIPGIAVLRGSGRCGGRRSIIRQRSTTGQSRCKERLPECPSTSGRLVADGDAVGGVPVRRHSPAIRLAVSAQNIYSHR